MSGQRGRGPVTMIGGEMLTWSDRGPAERAPAGGAALGYLIRRVVAGGRVLLAGPHDELLVAQARAAGAQVTWLLRSLPDAQVAARLGVRVWCGTLPKVAAEATFDAVVALDGLRRLCSVEGPQLGWADSLRALRCTLRPGGILLLSVENELGVHRLVDPSTPTASRTAGSWQALGEYDARPANPSALNRQLRAEELTVARQYAAWPTPDAPTVLIDGALAVDGPGVDGAGVDGAGVDGALAAPVSAAVASAYAGRPVLSDPRRLAATAVRAGLGPAFAPAWIAVAGLGPAPLPPVAPVLLGADGIVAELDREPAGRWVRRVVAGAPTTVAGGLRRDPARLNGELPDGRLLQEVLLAACLRHDLPTVRRLLGDWWAWLAEVDQPVFATFDNVLVDGDRLVVLDPSWSLAESPTLPAVGTRAVRRFATMLVRGGFSHPWPASTHVDELTAVLAAIAGVPVADEAVDLEIRITAGFAGTAPDDAVADEVRDPVVATPVTTPDSWRDRDEALRLLRRQLMDARAEREFLAGELAARELELRRQRMLASAFSGSIGYRLARLGSAAARRAKRLLRGTPSR